MAISKEQLKTTYPLPAYNYRVTILEGVLQQIPSDASTSDTLGGATVISCSEVTGLNMEIETVTYKHGMSFLFGHQIIPAQIKEVNLSIKKGITANGDYFSKWIGLVYPRITPVMSRLYRKRNILIDLCGENGEPVMRWAVVKAMPVKLTAPTFDANTNEVAFENLDLIASSLQVIHF